MGIIFSISEDNINNISSRLRRLEVDGEEAVDRMSNSLHKINESGLFDTSSLENGIRTLNSYISSSKYKLSSFTDAVFSGERNMYAKISEIEVPQDFVKNDNMPYNNIDDIKLSENIGDKINSDNYQKRLDNIDDSSVEEEKLRNITAEETRKANEISNSSVEEEKLRNITVEETRKANEISNSRVDEENLRNITSEGTRKINNDEQNSVQKESFKDIHNLETEKVNSTIDNSISSGQISNINSQGLQSNYSSNYSTNNLSSGSYESNSNENNDKNDYNDEFMKSYSMYEEYMKNKQHEENDEENNL